MIQCLAKIGGNMGTVTFHYLGNVSATPIPGSSGKTEERLEISCFPQNDATYHFRCRTPKGDLELEPLNPKPLPPRASKCCKSNLPKYIEMTLRVDNKQQRMELNLRSLAKRCHVSKEEVYDACAENRLFELLEDVGLPLKWNVLLTPTRLPKTTTGPIIQFLLANFREWKRQCEQGAASIFTRSGNGIKCDIEYFSDGAIYVLYIAMDNEKQIALAADLSGKAENPQWREFFHPDHFAVYDFCAKWLKNERGILHIYRTSQYPNRFHVYHEQYMHSLDAFMNFEPPEKREPALESKTNSPTDKSPLHRKNTSSATNPFLPPRRSNSPKSFRTGLLGASGKPLSTKAKVKLAIDLLSGLATLHKNRIVHLGLEPRAIFMHPETRRSEIEGVIGGFENARIVGPSTEKIMVSTTMKPPFLAPELTNNPLYQNHFTLPEVPFPADVYSLGIILRQLFEDVANQNISEIIARMVYSSPDMRFTADKALAAFMAINL